MKTEDIVRAWKDVKFRNTLSPQQLAELPSNPAGTFALSEQELNQAGGAGGTGSTSAYRTDCCYTAATCTEFCDL